MIWNLEFKTNDACGRRRRLVAFAESSKRTAIYRARNELIRTAASGNVRSVSDIRLISKSGRQTIFFPIKFSAREEVRDFLHKLSRIDKLLIAA